MKDPIGTITIPVYALPEKSFTGFRQNMLTAGPHALSTGGGLGSDAVWAELEEKGEMTYRYVTGRDILSAIAQLVNHPEADRFPVTEGAEHV